MRLVIMEEKKMSMFGLLVATMLGISSLGMASNTIKASTPETVYYEEQESSKSDNSSSIPIENYGDDEINEFRKMINDHVTEIGGKKVYIGDGTKVLKDNTGRTYYSPSPKKAAFEVHSDYIVVNGYKLSLDGKTLLAVPFEEKKCVIPEGVQTLNISAVYEYADKFYGYDEGCISWVTNITLPKSLKTINYDVKDFFEWNHEIHITNLTLKSTKLSAKDFSKFLRYFGSLKATDIHTPKKVGKCKKGMFIYKKTLVRYTGKAKKVVIPRGTVSIAAFAFSPFYMSCSVDNDYGFEEYLCSNETVKQVVLPKSMKSIGKYAFYGCRKLQKISIAKGGRIKSIGKKAFTGTKIKAAQRKSLV